MAPTPTSAQWHLTETYQALVTLSIPMLGGLAGATLAELAGSYHVGTISRLTT
jgi:hypothetical protein